MEELKPCPFCGGEATKCFELKDSVGGHTWATARVYCKKCSAEIDAMREVELDYSSVNPGVGFIEAEKHATDMWNRRTS